MKLSLHNVHYSKQLSRETNAFTAVLFIGDRAFARVRNDGGGGCNHYDPVTTGDGPSYQQIQALNACCQAQLESEHDPMAKIEPLDSICGRLLEETLLQKSLLAAAKRAPRRNEILYRTADDLAKPGAYRAARFTQPVPDEKMREHVRMKYPDAVFLADMKDAPSIEIPDVTEVLAA